jgi:2-desacetyl-2-hydroxyethyl bacteriochlorophyllide A dehydrogenase
VSSAALGIGAVAGSLINYVHPGITILHAKGVGSLAIGGIRSHYQPTEASQPRSQPRAQHGGIVTVPARTAAVVFDRECEASVRDIAMPPPGRDQVRVRTECSVVSSGTEGWAFKDQFTWMKTAYPCVPGYQRVGTITELGENVSGWQVGDRVIATTGEWSGEVTPFWGSHVAEGNTHAGELWRLPEEVDALDAAGLVVAQVGYNAASRLALDPGDWVAVYGDGIIGQCAAQAAHARDARVVLIGHRDERVGLAASHSADFAVNGRRHDAAAYVRELTGGKPVRAVLDTIQGPEVQSAYLPLLENGVGQIVYCGFTPGATWADMRELQKRELTTHYVAGWTRARMDATLELMRQRKMRLRPLITHTAPTSQADGLYRMILEKNEPFVGLAIDWTRS